jgi:cytochrome oxidase Cu insertion factor (SCO1/SenC/PrrC family)
MSRHRLLRMGTAALSGLLVVFAAGCSKLSHPAGFEKASAVGGSLNVTSYAMKGRVLAKSDVTHQVMIEQGTIAGYLPATDAVYTLKNGKVFDGLKPGDEIKGDVLVSADGTVQHLTDIVVTSEPAHPMTMAELPPHPMLVGESVPGIPMTNQNGKPTALTDYQGKAVLITFVDSQCKEDCPVITHMFAQINAMLKKNPAAWAHSHLITISIDPAHDTPPVLRKYGLEYLKGQPSGFAHWEFVDLTPANLKRLATDFNVSYEQTSDDIEHTMDITLIGPDNKVVRSWSGDDWNAKKIAAAVAAAATGHSQPDGMQQGKAAA